MWLRGLCVTPKGEISKWVLKKAPVRVCQWSKHLLHKNDDTIFYPLALWLIDFFFFWKCAFIYVQTSEPYKIYNGTVGWFPND